MHLMLSVLRHGFPMERLLLSAFLLSVLGATGIAIAMSFVQRSFSAAEDRVDRLNEQMQAAVLVVSALKDAEIAERDDLLSDGRATRARATAAIAAVQATRRALIAIGDSAGDGALKTDAEAVNGLLAQRLAELDRSVESQGRAFDDSATALQIRAAYGRLMTAFAVQRRRLDAQAARYGEHMGHAIIAVTTAVMLALALALAYGLILIEVRGRRAAAAKDAHAARHDVLTGLPNRALFQEWMNHTLANAQREATTPALIYLDLDGFKPINDSLGHLAGDHVLAEVARRFRGSARDADMLARLGGDEFAVLIPCVRDVAEARRLARRLIESLQEPIDFAGTSVHVGASAGIALADHAGQTSAALIASADQAMYRAKRAGKGEICA